VAINAAAVWRVRVSGSDTNGGGYDATISGAGTDYSQQDSAQATGTATSSGSTLTATTSIFTSAMVGNAVWINTATPQIRFITGYTSGTVVTLDAAPSATSVTINVGGAWASPTVNLTTTKNWVVPGNTVYIRGAGSDNPASADYTSTYISLVFGNITAGWIRIIGENGRPRISCTNNTLYDNTKFVYFENIYFAAGGATYPTEGMIDGGGSNTQFTAVNCVFDQNGQNVTAVSTLSGGGSAILISCEIYDSAGGSGGSYYGATLAGTTTTSIVMNCNIHNCKGGGLSLGGGGAVLNNVIAKNNGNGLHLADAVGYLPTVVEGNTIDGNTGHGININAVAALLDLSIVGNILSNQTGGSKYGLNVAAGTTAANDLMKGLIDFNWFYNNTGNYNAISGGPHDTTGSDPGYTDQTTQDYTPTSSAAIVAKGFPTPANPSAPIGATPAVFATVQPHMLRRSQTPTVKSHVDAGAAQRVMAAGGSIAVPVLGRIAG